MLGTRISGLPFHTHYPLLVWLCQREPVRSATPDPAASAGNLFRTADGRLAYIDFGMMGEVDPKVRR